LCALIGGLIYFAVKYRRKTPDQSRRTFRTTPLEFFSSLFHSDFHGGVRLGLGGLLRPARCPRMRWKSRFKDKSGVGHLLIKMAAPVRRSSGPIGPNGGLVMARGCHPQFLFTRVSPKQDVVPGRYTNICSVLRLRATINVFAPEYCGDQHSGMKAKLNVDSARNSTNG